MTFVFCNKSNDISEVLVKEQKKFFQDEVPKKMQFYFKNLFNDQVIEKSKLLFLDEVNKLGGFEKIDKFYLLEGHQLQYGDVKGYFWNENEGYSYTYSDLGGFVFNNNFNKNNLSFSNDIEEWGSVLNRSYRSSNILDGTYYLCSKVEVNKLKINVETTVFYSYDPNSEYFFLKESESDGFKTKAILKSELE